MFNGFIKLFIKNANDTENPIVRKKYGILSSITGIIINFFLSLTKIITGALTGAISVLSDGINNLSDAGSSIITLLGFKLSSKKPDKDHPFGHGRIEYFAGLVVSVLIAVVGVTLFTESLDKIIHFTETESVDKKLFIITCVVLGVSILFKLWMALFYKYVGKKINSVAIGATSSDSLSDCISTAVVLICSVLTLYVKDFSIDGVAGIVVSVFIFITGVKSTFEIIGLLLGKAPDPELVKDIATFVTNYDKNVVGVHDLMLHDYGPGRKILILHVEVPADGDIMKLHDLIDNIECSLEEKFNCQTTIHMDPVVVNNERVNSLKEKLKEIVKELDENFNIHDIRMNEGDTHANLIFDLVVTHETKLKDKEINEYIKKKIKEYDPKINAVIKIEYSMV